MPGAIFDDFAELIGAERARLDEQRARVQAQIDALAEVELALARYAELSAADPHRLGDVGATSGRCGLGWCGGARRHDRLSSRRGYTSGRRSWLS
jgi:hypothetical protein